MPCEVVKMKCVYLHDVHNGSLSSSEIPMAVETCEIALSSFSPSLPSTSAVQHPPLCEDGAQTHLPTHGREAARKVPPY